MIYLPPTRRSLRSALFPALGYYAYIPELLEMIYPSHGPRFVPPRSASLRLALRLSLALLPLCPPPPSPNSPDSLTEASLGLELTLDGVLLSQHRRREAAARGGDDDENDYDAPPSSLRQPPFLESPAMRWEPTMRPLLFNAFKLLQRIAQKPHAQLSLDGRGGQVLPFRHPSWPKAHRAATAELESTFAGRPARGVLKERHYRGPDFRFSVRAVPPAPGHDGDAA